MSQSKPIFFPGLNGLRAIAAIGVVISHTTVGLNAFHLDPTIIGTYENGEPKGLDIAAIGVSIFFALSGFLITYLLQVEKEKAPIDVKKFYIRRILRIWPLYYLYLIVCVATLLIQQQPINSTSLLLYIFYAANVPYILNTALPYLGHYWSLGVEEQFYLFWPWINKKIKSLARFCILSAAIIIGVKILLHYLHPDSLLERFIHFTRFHCMMIGAAGAVLYKENNKMFLQWVDNKIVQTICWIIMAFVLMNKFQIATFLDNEFISVITVFLIIGQIRVKNRIVNLENKVMDFLGRISYGIYVLHVLLIFVCAEFLNLFTIPTTTKYVLAYVTVLASTIGLAYLSFNYFERYFLKFKHKFEVVKSAASRKAVQLKD